MNSSDNICRTQEIKEKSDEPGESPLSAVQGEEVEEENTTAYALLSKITDHDYSKLDSDNGVSSKLQEGMF